MERFQVVIFGASGYTGKYAIREATKVLKNYRWAVAGRSREKLEETLAKVSKIVDRDLSKVPIIIADINDERSLREMTKQAQVLVNCCGPYRFLGEAVVRACIDTGTSHVDVSGEPHYMENVLYKYDDLAREKGVYIVSACGYDSMPSDMGVVFLQENFKGTVNTIETYLNSWFIRNYEPTGAGVHYATFESAVHGFANANELRELRKKLFANKLPKLLPILEEKGRLHKAHDIHKKWCLSVPTADHSVIMRSQRHFFENDNQRPIQLRTYHAYDSLLTALKVIMTGMLFTLLTKYELGRKLLLENPKFFTNGFASHEGPTDEYNENSVFEIIFVGKGWSEKLKNPTDEMPINKRLMTRVVCSNPLYGSASVAVLCAAKMIIDESDKMPKGGGVFAPGAAFRDTNLIRELHEHGIKFEVLTDQEIVKSKL